MSSPAREFSSGDVLARRGLRARRGSPDPADVPTGKSHALSLSHDTPKVGRNAIPSYGQIAHSAQVS